MKQSQAIVEDDYDLFLHQRQLLTLVEERPDISYFFLIGGFGAGKSFTGVALILHLVEKYAGFPLAIGLGGTTISLLEKTIVADLIKMLIISNTKYSFDHQKHIIKIGTVSIQLVPTEQPSLIYAYNFHIFICDELDELRQDIALEAFKASQERTRIPIPGRRPFSVFLTTAQGYRGTYQIIEDLRSKGKAFVKVRGRTKDNTRLDSEFYDRLWSLYTDNERLAFLEGHFVNLTSGRVYPEYDEATCMVEDMTVDASETIYIGQDLNSGFSKAIALVQRGNVLYGVKEFSFKAIGDAPALMRAAFPMNRILWFPDSSGKEILAGYQAEVRQQGIEIRMSPANPPINERIFFKNKLFKLGRFKVFRSLKEYPMALKTRQFDQSGMPEKGKGEKASDHICDSAEYVVFRLVSMQPEFRDLFSLSRTQNR